MIEHKKLYHKKVSTVVLHFVLAHLSRKQSVVQLNYADTDYHPMITDMHLHSSLSQFQHSSTTSSTSSGVGEKRPSSDHTHLQSTPSSGEKGASSENSDPQTRYWFIVFGSRNFLGGARVIDAQNVSTKMLLQGALK